jgi:Methylamine utilisation protein MauE
MIYALIFTVISFLLCAAAVLAVFGIIQKYMSGSDAIERDGMLPGSAAPSWSIADSAGRVHHSPSASGLQLIIFGNHGLKAFPSLLEGLRELSDLDPALEIIVLSDGYSSLTEPFFKLIGLENLTIITGSRSLYGRYNVRVSPFAILVDSAGRVRASSLVNHDWQIMTLYKIACLEPDPVSQPGTSSPNGQLAKALGRMNEIAAAAKAGIAVILLVAGGAKLADLSGFGATLRLFLPGRTPRAAIRGCAVAIVAAELLLGGVSLCLPAVRWLNPVILALTCVFVIVTATGFAVFRGRSCRCFGALSSKKFDRISIARSCVLVVMAALAMGGLGSTAGLSGLDSALLAVASVLLILGTFTAARALDAGATNLGRT